MTQTRAAGRKKTASSSRNNNRWEKEKIRVVAKPMEPMVSHGRSNRSRGSAESQTGHHQDRNTKIATIQKILPPLPSLSIFLSLPPSLHPMVVPSGYCEIVSMEMWVRAAASPLMLQCEFGCKGFKPQQAAPGWRDGWMDGPMVKRRKQNGEKSVVKCRTVGFSGGRRK